ncbi:hypothetical protein J3459_012459 [Metarhizium acridum]|nr:hypothetical protein J3459_012459 [Metarhizium acridum]
MIGTTAEEFSSFVPLAKWDYAKFHSLFTSSYTSKAAAENVLQAYNILPTSSQGELFEALTQFIFDATMVHKVHRAGEIQDSSQEASSTLSLARTRTVWVFKVTTSRHCVSGVELVYAVGIFHETLDGADKGFSEGYVEPKRELAEAAVSKASPSVEIAQVADDMAMEYVKSNIDLSYELQDKFIQFVTEDCGETDERADPDKITTYSRNRATRAESWASNEKWKTRKKRYNALEKDLDAVLVTTRKGGLWEGLEYASRISSV